MTMSDSKSKATWIIVVIVVAAVALVVLPCCVLGGVALLLPNVSKVREAARQTEPKNNLNQFREAIREQESKNDRLPPELRP
jgi:flagellar basal body-associated protein FliL